MDSASFDRLSKAFAQRLRRRSVAGSLGASALTLKFGEEKTSAQSVDREALLAQTRAVLKGGSPFATEKSAGGSALAESSPGAAKSKKKPKCEKCDDCTCSIGGGYIYGMTNTLCIVFYDDKQVQEACSDEGLVCAQKEAACQNSDACLDDWFYDWFGV